MKDQPQPLPLKNTTWCLFDESISGRQRSALESFAADDTLCHLVGQQLRPPTVRTWVHAPTIVLGMQDHRLPYIEEAVPILQQAGFEVIVRNSGGLAVVLDEGVLNVSLVFSERAAAIDIPEGYERMLTFVRLLFPEIADRIQAYEIVGSYCPGSYDLSVGGKKFAGISQRRLRQGVAVQVYLCIEGSGAERARHIQTLYEIGLQGEQTKFTYPTIVPEVMTSLSELYGQPLTVQAIVMRIQQLLRQTVDHLQVGHFAPDELPFYTMYLQRVVDRNTKLLAFVSDDKKTTDQ